MTIFYYGADQVWSNQNETDIRRRNMAILKAMSNIEEVSCIYNIIRVSRRDFFKLKKNKNTFGKVLNIYITNLFPDRGIFKKWSSKINFCLLQHFYRKAFKASISTDSINWCYWPKGYLDYKFLNLPGRLIFDTDHNIIEDPNISKEHTDERSILLLEIGSKADWILSSSRSMLLWFEDRGFTNTKLLMNGVFKQRINLTSKNSLEIPYKVTYCGTLSKWINLDWLVSLINDRPQWEFHIIGKNYKTDFDKVLEKFENVILHGYLDPEKVDVLIASSNVCIGIYHNHPALDVNSMKLYDYLAQYKPVVINNYHNHLQEDFSDTLNIANTYAQFLHMIEHPKHVAKQDIETFLSNATWETRISKTLKTITN